MSSNLNIQGGSDLTAPTPQNTPLNQAPISLGLSRPTVPDISEDNETEDTGEVNDIDEDDLSGIQAHALGMVQSRLAELVGKSSGYIEALPVEVKANVEALKGVQVKQSELVNQYKLECLALEKKYLDLTKPLYERRKAIINGTATATKEEIEAGESVSKDDNDEYTDLPKDVSPSPSGIPDFWLTALQNHLDIGELITERDAVALKHLVDVQLQYLDDSNTPEEFKGKPGFKLLFFFSPNEFFENDVIEKTYVYSEKVGYGGDFTYDRAIGTEIKWKEDKDLTKEFEIKKQRNKTTQRTRLVRKAKPVDSFFNFFYPPQAIAPEALDNGEIDVDELDELDAKLGMDYQIGEDLKDKASLIWLLVIPRAVDYFTGKALEYDFEEEDDEYSDFEDDEGEGSEDESEEDDVPARRRAPKKGGQVNPEECKQQ
ncbi:nucleosome assembly protein I [Coprinopsis marcescibilis]|uniref:Nucleosome assembly protein I n=1 Tax=Coprinopsis marcescibilis TaxID=230819 RepID=A0A5C3KVN8_COPMA|nr:nucleosome assembly protein I [Coprinopsis marcescibilis]